MANLNPGNGAIGNHGAAAAPARDHRAKLPAQHTPFKDPLAPKHTVYGLPCAHCKTYYASELSACPICGGMQRVSAVQTVANVAPAEQLPDPEQLEWERERFLKDLNSQVISSPLPPELPAPLQNCTHIENHASAPEAATVCQSCYDRLQERVDIFEAALHIDIKEAAQIVYEAVWADPSDPSKTYQNAALALLKELRRRSGTPQVFGPLQPPVN